MIKKKTLKGWLLFIFLAGVFMTIMVNIVLEKTKHWVGTVDDTINSYEIREYDGKVVKKFIDKKEHNDKTLILLQKENGILSRKKQIFRFDISGFYEYVAVGDSLVKKEGDLFATVYREGEKDTVIYFKFKNYETGEVFPKE